MGDFPSPVLPQHEDKLDSALGLLAEIRDLLAARPIGSSRPVRQKKEVLVEAGLPRLAQIWNQWADASLPRVVMMEPGSTRHKACEERWKLKPDEPFWVGVIRKLNASAFCMGENDRRWKADIDFLTRKDQAAKILEGKFDNRNEKKPSDEMVVTGYWTDPDGVQHPVMGRRKGSI